MLSLEFTDMAITDIIAIPNMIIVIVPNSGTIVVPVMVIHFASEGTSLITSTVISSSNS